VLYRYTQSYKTA